MANETQPQTKTVVAFGEEASDVFPGLTKAEEVIVWAGIGVGILGVCAILLRLIMPLVRKRYRRSKDGRSKHVVVNGSTGQLLGSSTPSSSSRASTLSRSSHHDDHKSREDLTFVSTISGNYSPPKTSLYGSGGRGGDSVPVFVSNTKSHTSSTGPSVLHQQQLNQQLTSVLSTPTLHRLQSLNLNEVYRDNWDRTFSPFSPHSHSLSHHGHASESRQMAHDVPSVHQPVANTRDHVEVKTRL